MERLGVEYDVLPRESEILHLKFWAQAFEQLKVGEALERLLELDQVAAGRGLPAVLRTGNGLEFCGRAMLTWAHARGVTLRLIQPGKPTQNAYIESFFHSMKSEIYHGLTYQNDDEVRAVLRSYLPFYNSARLHSSLNYVSPATFEQLT